MVQRHPLGADFKPGTLVLPINESKRLDEGATEVIHAPIPLPELRLECRPRNKLRAVRRYPVHLLRFLRAGEIIVAGLGWVSDGHGTRRRSSLPVHPSNAPAIWLFACGKRPSASAASRMAEADTRASWPLNSRISGPVGFEVA